MTDIETCPACGKDFEKRAKHQVFCCRDCKDRWHRYFSGRSLQVPWDFEPTVDESFYHETSDWRRKWAK